MDGDAWQLKYVPAGDSKPAYQGYHGDEKNYKYDILTTCSSNFQTKTV